MPIFSSIMPLNNFWKCPNLHLTRKYLILQVTIDFIKSEPHRPLKTNVISHYFFLSVETTHYTQ